MDEASFESTWKNVDKRNEMVKSFIIIDEDDSFFFDNRTFNITVSKFDIISQFQHVIGFNGSTLSKSEI